MAADGRPLKNGQRRDSTPKVNVGWLSYRPELSVLVEVWSDDGLQIGMLRGLSAEGALIEMRISPPLGTEVTVAFRGMPGTVDAPEPMALRGRARHLVSWTLGSEARNLRAVAVRWTECRPFPALRPARKTTEIH